MTNGIWIRSQDGETFALVRCFEVAQYGDRKCKRIVIAGDGVLTLGEYKTVDRAMEVVQEIQENVLRKKKLYKMPEE